MTALATALAILALIAFTEWLHTRRVRRVAMLAFGPGGRAREWTWLAPFLRTVSFALLAWGLVTLLLIFIVVLLVRCGPLLLPGPQVM